VSEIDLGRILEDFRQRVRALAQERDRLDQRRAEINRQIAGLQQSVVGLEAYARASEDSGIKWGEVFKDIAATLGEAAQAWTLTETCKNFVQSKQEGVTPAEIKLYLEQCGFFAGYESNPLSSIHTILKRLIGQDEIREIDFGGIKRYGPLGALEKRKRIPPIGRTPYKLPDLPGPVRSIEDSKAADLFPPSPAHGPVDKKK
jgi:hypothetical protein